MYVDGDARLADTALGARLAHRRGVRLALSLPLAWALMEWSRNWLLTGFPWQALGYSQAPYGPLAAYAPIVGVYGVSLLAALSAGAVVTDFDPSLPRLSCHPGEINQVVLNLIVNAAHAIEEASASQAGAKGVITVTTRRCGGWAQIRLNVGSFMQGLFRQGAFAGKTPREAYLVKCDSETTTQADVNLGIVNIIVGFAPLKPAEFETASQKFEFQNPALAKLPAYAAQRAPGDEKSFPLTLIPYDTMRLASGPIGSPPFLVKALEETALQQNTALVDVNPATAKELGLAEGSAAVLSTPTGFFRTSTRRGPSPRTVSPFTATESTPMSTVVPSFSTTVPLIDTAPLRTSSSQARLEPNPAAAR